jgi:hypothetical protein
MHETGKECHPRGQSEKKNSMVWQKEKPPEGVSLPAVFEKAS